MKHTKKSGLVFFFLKRSKNSFLFASASASSSGALCSHRFRHLFGKSRAAPSPKFWQDYDKTGQSVRSLTRLKTNEMLKPQKPLIVLAVAVCFFLSPTYIWTKRERCFSNRFPFLLQCASTRLLVASLGHSFDVTRF